MAIPLLHSGGRQTPHRSRTDRVWSDVGLVGLSRFLDGSGAEVAGGDDEPLLVRSEAATHLLNYRGQDVVLELPFLDLDGHLDADNVTNHQGTPDIDAAVAAELGHLNHLESHLRQ